MPTIDAHGSLHDSQGRYANQDKPAAGFDLNAAPANSGDVTLTEADFLDNDELMFARETLGPDASYIEVRELAAERARIAYDEHLSKLKRSR